MDKVRNHFIHNVRRGRLLTDKALAKYARRQKLACSLSLMRKVKLSWLPFAMKCVHAIRSPKKKVLIVDLAGDLRPKWDTTRRTGVFVMERSRWTMRFFFQN